MAEPTIQLGGGNWAGKTDNLLGYYKEGERFYKQDFTFSRSTTGTYTDKEGYIQEMPYNLLTYSEDFSNSGWSKGDVTISAKETISPDGQLNAYKITDNTNNARHRLSDAVTLSSSTAKFTSSVFLKQGTHRYAFLNSSSGSNAYTIVVDLQNGIKTAETESGADNDFEIKYFENGWYRLSVTIVAASTTAFVQFGTAGSATPTYNNFIPTYAGSSEHIFVFGAQLNKGTSAKTYFPTTTRLNMPRVDYKDNSNGSLKLEPQSTNLITYSSDFSQWTKTSNASVTSNNTISPDGTLNADKINFLSATTGVSFVKAFFSNGKTYSVYVKYDNLQYIMVYADGLNGGRHIDIKNRIIGPNLGAAFNCTIEDVGNDWSKITMFGTSASGISFEIYSSNGTSYNPATVGSVYIWGAQVETGSYPTSIINTSGSSVTRNQDACTDGGDASRFNSSEGVLFAEIAALANDGTYRLISLSDGTETNRITFFYQNSPSNTIAVESAGSGTNLGIYGQSLTITNSNKIAIKYKANDCALWVNGVEVATDTSFAAFSSGTFTKLSFDRGDGIHDFYGKCNQIQVYNTALTDTELAALTTL